MRSLPQVEVVGHVQRRTQEREERQPAVDLRRGAELPGLDHVLEVVQASPDEAAEHVVEGVEVVSPDVELVDLLRIEVVVRVTVEGEPGDGEDGLPLSDASYDDQARVFRWTPELLHIGKQTAEFDVSDGTATRKFVLKLTVLAPFVTE